MTQQVESKTQSRYILVKALIFLWIMFVYRLGIDYFRYGSFLVWDSWVNIYRWFEPVFFAVLLTAAHVWYDRRDRKIPPAKA